MEKINITAVSFLNTLPFIYGIQNAGLLPNYKLQLVVPSKCAALTKVGLPDIALVPVAAFYELQNYELLQGFCLGSENIVRSVLLLSNTPIENIKTIFLDEHSRSSNELVKILAEKYWKIKPDFKQNIPFDGTKFSGKISIGDKAFIERKAFKYAYDLAEFWNILTGLPFVFAVWVTKKKLCNNVVEQFSASLKFGLSKIDELIEKQQLTIKYPLVDVYTYLHTNMNYIFDDKKQQAFSYYLSLIS